MELSPGMFSGELSFFFLFGGGQFHLGNRWPVSGMEVIILFSEMSDDDGEESKNGDIFSLGGRVIFFGESFCSWRCCWNNMALLGFRNSKDFFVSS